MAREADKQTEDLNIADLPSTDDLAHSLLTLGVVAEADLTKLGTARDGKNAASVLELLRKTGSLSDFQVQRIQSLGIDSLRFGPYLLLDRLGEGGMGEVLLARQIELDREVALKILPESVTNSKESRERFRREVRLLGKLDHPGIVTAMDAGHHKNTPYLSMELLRGGTLQDVLNDRGPIAWNRMLRWTIPICDALEYSHRRGIIHRDIKPSNLAIDDEKGVKILDLGLARATQMDSQDTEGFATSAGHVLGTVDFMPPEQAMADADLNPTADIYSLGCTIFTLLTGRPVFPASSVIDKVIAHRNTTPPSLINLRPEVPPEFDSLFQRMIAKNPADRPQAMSMVAEELGEIAEQYQLSDSTVPAVLLGKEPPSDTVSIRKPATDGSLEATTRQHGKADRPRSWSSPWKIGVAATAAFVLIVVGTATYRLTRSPGEPAGRQAAASSQSRTVDHDKRIRPQRIPVDETDASASQSSELLRTVLLAGGEFSIEDPSAPGRLLSVTMDEVPDDLSQSKGVGVRFRHDAPTAALLKSLASSIKLVELTVRSQRANSLRLRAIASAESLKRLEIDAEACDAADLVWLRKNLGLRELIVHGAKREHVDRITGLDQLTSLSLIDGPLDEASVMRLASMTFLKHLILTADPAIAKASAKVIEANSTCEFRFQHSDPLVRAKLLVALRKSVESAEAKMAVYDLLHREREVLKEVTSWENYRALRVQYEGYSYDELCQRGDEHLADDARSTALACIAMNEKLRASTWKVREQHLIREAGRMWKTLGDHFYRAQDYENGRMALQKAFVLLNAIELRKPFGTLASVAESISRHMEQDADQYQEWRETAESMMRRHHPAQGTETYTAAWAHHSFAWRCPDKIELARHLDRSGDLAARFVTPESCPPTLARSSMHAFNVYYQLGKVAEAKVAIDRQQEFLQRLPQFRDLEEFRIGLLGRQCAIAIATEDRSLLTQAINDLASIQGRVEDGILNYMAWDFLSLRGWMDPFDESEIVLEPHGTWPAVAHHVAQGHLNFELRQRLDYPPASSPRHFYYRAQELRLRAGQKPSEEDRQIAKQIWDEQKAIPNWQMIAMVAAMLGPITGEPLTDVSWPVADVNQDPP